MWMEFICALGKTLQRNKSDILFGIHEVVCQFYRIAREISTEIPFVRPLSWAHDTIVMRAARWWPWERVELLRGRWKFLNTSKVGKCSWHLLMKNITLFACGSIHQGKWTLQWRVSWKAMCFYESIGFDVRTTSTCPACRVSSERGDTILL